MTIELDGPLLLAGAGKMGGAMLAGWLEGGLDPRLVVVQDPAPPPEIAALLAKYDIEPRAEVGSLDHPPSVLIAAVKPQVMDKVFPPLGKTVGPETLVLSIAAGKTIAFFEKHLPPGTAVVRAMPNTPAAIGRGITGLCANAHVDARRRELTEALLSAVGEVAWVEEEALIDAVTAVSGSGPAYIFLLAECLAEAGRAVGLDADTAARLARATVSGAGELLHQSELPAAELRKNVTSPGGTTAAALSVLMADGSGLQELMTKAVAAAAARGRELAG